MLRRTHPRQIARVLIATACTVGTLAAGKGYSGKELAKEAKITIAQARQVALKAYPGKTTDEKLEREQGGSRLHYGFDIRSGKMTQEVDVDAVTGALMENQPEGRTPD